MRKAWLLFSQTVTVAVALLFVVATMKPGWLKRGPEAVATAADGYARKAYSSAIRLINPSASREVP